MELNENNYQEFVEKIVGGMDDDERKHLQFITTKLIACYGKDSPFSAVLCSLIAVKARLPLHQLMRTPCLRRSCLWLVTSTHKRT